MYVYHALSYTLILIVLLCLAYIRGGTFWSTYIRRSDVPVSVGSGRYSESYTHTIRESISCWVLIPLIICYVWVPHRHIIRDYKNFNPRVNVRLVLSLYVCVTHTHELNPLSVRWEKTTLGKKKWDEIRKRRWEKEIVDFLVNHV